MDNDFRDWDEEYNPFDAIGMAKITEMPPSPKLFAKCCQYTRFVTNPSRLNRTPELASQLPYSLAQIEKAITFFAGSGNGSLERGREKPDDITWEWGYESIILGECRGVYTRRWAPERVRIENVLLASPIRMFMTEIKSEETRDDEPELSKADIVPVTIHSEQPARSDPSSEPAAAPPGPACDESTNASRIEQPIDSPMTTDLIEQERGALNATLGTQSSSTKSNADLARPDVAPDTQNLKPNMAPSHCDTIPIASSTTNTPAISSFTPDTPTPAPATVAAERQVTTTPSTPIPNSRRGASSADPFDFVPKKKRKYTKRTNAQKPNVHSPAAPGTFTPKVLIFLGFFRPQLSELPRKYHTREHDFRVPVFGQVTDARGRIGYGTHVTNMAGVKIPLELRSQRGGQVKLENIVLAGDFVGLSGVEVRLELARKTRLVGWKNPSWIATPDFEVESRVGEGVKVESGGLDGASEEAVESTTTPNSEGSIVTAPEDEVMKDDDDVEESPTASDEAALPTAPTPEKLTPPRRISARRDSTASLPQENLRSIISNAMVTLDTAGPSVQKQSANGDIAQNAVDQLQKRLRPEEQEEHDDDTQRNPAKKLKFGNGENKPGLVNSGDSGRMVSAEGGTESADEDVLRAIEWSSGFRRSFRRP